nr:hypothetical protein [Halococcus thailandensis]
MRVVAGALFGLITALYFGIVGWVLLSLLDSGTISVLIAGVGLLVATLIFLGVVRFARKYVLYLVDAGHIAVIAHTIDTGTTPANQWSFGTNAVKGNFTEASSLFVVDQLIKSVVKQFNRSVISFSGLVDFVPTLETILTFLRRGIALAASYIDEAILAHTFLNPEQNNWRAARDGVVLYGKTWKSVLGSTLLIVGGMYVVTFALLFLLSPLAGVLGGMSSTFEVLGWVVVFGIALTIYLGVLRPWVKTVVITTFLIESRNKTPDSNMMDSIAGRSKKFKELMANAEAESDDERPTDPTEDGDSPEKNRRSPG